MVHSGKKGANPPKDHHGNFTENGRFTNCTIVSQLTDACFQEVEHRMEHIRTRLHDNPLGFISQEMLYLSTDKLPL